MVVKGHEFHREIGSKAEDQWPCSKKNQFGCKSTVKILKGLVYESSYKHNHDYKICFNQNLETTCINLEPPAQTQESQYNSDDDVIEVVRDEAPIEILSDGEELEIQLQQSQDALKDIVIANVFAPDNINEKDKEKDQDPVEDPLNTDTESHNNFCSDLLDALNPLANQSNPIENSIPTEAEFSTKIALETKESDPIVPADNITVVSNDNIQDNSGRIETIIPNDDGLIELKARLIEQDGRSVLMVNKHRYMRHYTSRGGRTRWRCCKSFNKCLAIAITYDNQIVKLNDTHNHEPLSPLRKGRKPRNQSTDSSTPFSPQSSRYDNINFRPIAPMPTLEISPLEDGEEKYSRINERIVVKPCEDLFS